VQSIVPPWLIALALVRTSTITPCTEVTGRLAAGLHLARQGGHSTLRELLLWFLHLGYRWLALVGWQARCLAGKRTICGPAPHNRLRAASLFSPRRGSVEDPSAQQHRYELHHEPRTRA
jgi:hypothetical protein